MESTCPVCANWEGPAPHSRVSVRQNVIAYGRTRAVLLFMNSRQTGPNRTFICGSRIPRHLINISVSIFVLAGRAGIFIQDPPEVVELGDATAKVLHREPQ